MVPYVIKHFYFKTTSNFVFFYIKNTFQRNLFWSCLKLFKTLAQSCFIKSKSLAPHVRALRARAFHLISVLNIT